MQSERNQAQRNMCNIGLHLHEMLKEKTTDRKQFDEYKCIHTPCHDHQIKLMAIVAM